MEVLQNCVIGRCLVRGMHLSKWIGPVGAKHEPCDVLCARVFMLHSETSPGFGLYQVVSRCVSGSNVERTTIDSIAIFVGATSWELCQEACLDDASCNVWTWRNGAHPSAPNTCHLGTADSGAFTADPTHVGCEARSCQDCTGAHRFSVHMSVASLTGVCTVMIVCE